MNIIITPNYTELSKQAAQIITQRICQKPTLTLGLATGSTPIGMYQQLVILFKNQEINFQHVTTFNLDEYVGLAPDHEQSYHFFMQKNFFEHVNIDKKNIFIPDGLTKNPKEYCAQYEQEIQNHGSIDLQILGIGRDGHIGFNEPGSPITSRTSITQLNTQTIHDNARFFDHDLNAVPKQAITMGIATILGARECILLASGTAKAEIIAQALTGPICENVPASFLQKHHNLTVILDQSAATNINYSSQ